MKNIFWVIVLFFPFYLFSQDTITPNRNLKYDRDIAYYKAKKFTGQTIKNINGIDVLFNYKDGLLDGKVKIRNELFTYSKGVITEYVYFVGMRKELIHIYNLSLTKPISRINLSIKLDNEKNNAIYYKKDEIIDTIKFKPVIYIHYKTNRLPDIIPLDNLKFESARISSACKGFDMEKLIFSEYIPKEIGIPRFNKYFYIDDIKYKASNNEIINFDFRKIKILEENIKK